MLVKDTLEVPTAIAYPLIATLIGFISREFWKLRNFRRPRDGNNGQRRTLEDILTDLQRDVRYIKDVRLSGIETNVGLIGNRMDVVEETLRRRHLA